MKHKKISLQALFCAIIKINIFIPNISYALTNVNASDPECLEISGKNADINLDEIMYYSTQNAQVQSLIDLIESSNYVLRSNKQFYVPQVTFGGSYTYFSNTVISRLLEEVGSNSQYIFNQSYPNYLEVAPSLTINQNIFNLSQQALISSSVAQVRAQRYQTLAQAQSNALSSAQLYNSIIQNFNSALSIDQIVKAYNKQYENIFILQKSGEASLIDLLSAKAQLQLYQQELLQIRATIMTQKSELETLTNKNICEINSKHYLPFPNIEKLPYVSESNEAEAIKLSPVVNNFKASSDVAKYIAQSYRLSYLPNISAQLGMTGTYQFGNVMGTKHASNEYDLSSSPYVQLSLNWPFFDGGKNISLAKSQIKSADSNQKLMQQTSLQIKNDIQSYYQNDILNIASLEKANYQTIANKKLLDLVSIGYKAGYLTYINFQVQASSLYTANLNLFSTQANLLNNRLQYYALFFFRGFKNTNNSLQNIQKLSK
jgi:outer membrane protein TolC